MPQAADSDRACFNFPGVDRPGFSEAVRTGPWIAVSGQVPTLNGELVGGDDAEAQARQVFANMRSILNAAGADLSDVVRLTCFLVEESAFPAYAKVKQELFKDKPPAGTAVVVKGLFAKGAFLEVEALAWRPEKPA